MIGLQFKGEWIDLSSNAVFTFTFVNPLYLGGDSSTIFGGYSTPLTLPPSDRNKRLFNNVDRIDSTSKFIEAEAVNFHYDGLFIFEGLLYVKKSTNKSFQIFVVINDLKSIENLNMLDIDYGPPVHIGDTEVAREATMTDTVVNPHHHPFSFFYVASPDANPDTFYPSADSQNYYTDSKVKELPVTSGATVYHTPFLKLEYVLEKAFETIGNYTFINLFQDHAELIRLYLYNNVNMYNAQKGHLDEYVDISKFVPDIKFVDFLIEISEAFNLVLFVNYFTKEIELVKAKDVYNYTSFENWDDKILEGYEKTPLLDSYPGVFEYASLDGLDSEIPSVVDRVFDTVSAAEAFLPLLDIYETEIIYINSVNAYFTRSVIEFDFGFGPVPMNYHLLYRKLYKPFEYSDNDPVTFGLPPVHMHSKSYLPVRSYDMIPLVERDKKDKVCSPHLIFYRGINQVHPGYFAPAYFPLDIPVASNNEYGHDTIAGVTYDYSLLLNRPNGIINQFWPNLAQDQNAISRKARLSKYDIQKFSFKNKIRHQNMNYFVKEMTITFAQNEIKPVDLILVNTT